MEAVAIASSSQGERAQQGDERVAARCRAGDSQAFAELMQRHMGTVFGVAYGVLRDRDEASDIVQDVFLKLSQTLPRMRVRGSLGPWLYRVAMNRAIDRVRQVRRHNVINGEPDDGFAGDDYDPGMALETTELREAISRAVARLPEKQRMVFTMRHISGLSLDEIAGAMNCATGTVKCHLARATRRLREMLEPYLREACPP